LERRAVVSVARASRSSLVAVSDEVLRMAAWSEDMEKL
jgi:hypothetical protein